MKFTLHSEYKPAGDQPEAIETLVSSINAGEKHQTLLGVTGSGKTFTIANVIERIQKPTLVIAHNKTLAAQLAAEYREFFPENAVHYFVSYYDYYQPEAYMPGTDTYIEKEAQINAEIDRLRHASTQALLTRKDVIIVASVSCIYGLGSPVEYEKVNLRLSVGDPIGRTELLRKLIAIYYERTNADLTSGTFRAIGNAIEIMPVSEKYIVRLDFKGDTIARIATLDDVSRQFIDASINDVFLFPAKHFVADKTVVERAIKTITAELEERLIELEKEGKVLEYERLKRRTRYDLAMIRETGYCNGIENYSRHFSNQLPGEAPDSLLSYFPHTADGAPDFLTVIDESHVTIPQIGGMFAGDQSRKGTLVEHGFRLPSAKDNRPLRFEEFEKRIGQAVYVSATPGKYEAEYSHAIAEQIIRPTGLVDPKITVRPVTPKGKYEGQIQDFIAETEKAIAVGGRVLATTLTKKMAEDLSEYLSAKGMKAIYIHSDIKTIERIEIIRDFRKGKYDILVGVNLLREGLDMPEVTLIGILDADKEGFLRSETALIQTIGRAARNVDGHVILYADHMTGSMERAIGETDRRRNIQLAYNAKHDITPKTIIKAIHDIAEGMQSEHTKALKELMKIDKAMFDENPEGLIKQKKKQMEEAVSLLDFETAALVRDEIREIETLLENAPGKKKVKKERKWSNKK